MHWWIVYNKIIKKHLEWVNFQFTPTLGLAKKKLFASVIDNII